jgi:hypothetical protein
MGMWDKVAEAVHDDMAERWYCPKCSGETAQKRYCLRACKIHGVMGPDGKVVLRDWAANQAGDYANTKFEHLHVTCMTCGYETLEDCHDKTSSKSSEPTERIEP